MAPRFSMVYVTAKDMAEAQKISKHLIGLRLVACSNLFPIKSIYKWEGRVETSDEVALIMKTRSSLVDEVIEEIRLVHTYKVPCIVAYPMANGLPSYLEWIMAETRSRKRNRRK